MGRTLGGLWAAAGHEVFFGARRTEAADEAAVLARAHATAEVRSGTNHQAATFGDILLYCIREIDPADAIGDRDVLHGKPLVDLNNRAIPSDFQFEMSPISLAEALQTQAPNAKVVKAFNMLAQEVFEIERAELQDKRVSVLIATDDTDARAAVEILTRDLGMTPINGGPLRNARLLESAADLVRYLIAGASLGPLTTLSVPPLTSSAELSRFGGRRTSKLHGEEGQRIVAVGQRVKVESSGQIDAPIEALWRLDDRSVEGYPIRTFSWQNGLCHLSRSDNP
jgi:predicted dinucleotide-binding enzyme